MHNLIAHALIENGNGEFLIMKRSMQRGGKRNFEGGKWDIPGGKVEAFETLQEAAIRSILIFSMKSIMDISAESPRRMGRNRMLISLAWMYRWMLSPAK